MEQSYPLFWLLLTLSGMVAGGSYLWIKIQVWKSGDRHRFFSLDHDAHVFRQYRLLAKQNRIRVWPLWVYWSSVFVFLGAGFGMVVTLHR